MRVIGISGSLRRGSSNGRLLRIASSLAPQGMEIVLYESLGLLPHFNPDLDTEQSTPPESVRTFRDLLIAADGVLISSPEYAHGVPGTLKNALDWLVSVGELAAMPVLLMNAAPAGGEFAQAALLETLRVMNWNILRDASLVAPFLTRKLAAGTEMSADEQAAIGNSLAQLASAIRDRSTDRAGRG